MWFLTRPVDDMHVKGTPGIGDSMLALNCAHNTSSWYDTHVNLTFHWNHGEDFLYHFEDPETIIERTDYIRNFYYQKDRVTVHHLFNSYPPMVEARRVIGREPLQNLNSNQWMFDPRCDRPAVPNKVVIWRPLFNADRVRAWKEALTRADWDKVIFHLEQHGCNVVELQYRTPISEVMYHISTCDFVFCYDGMWHYIAKNFFKPMIVVSGATVTQAHTPHCLQVAGKAGIRAAKYLHFDKKGDSVYKHIHKKAQFEREKVTRMMDKNEQAAQKRNSVSA